MKKIIFLIVVVVGIIFILKMSNKENQARANGMSIDPIEHASMILDWDGVVIYTDPVGKNLFAGKPDADIVLLTDIHGDHFNLETLKSVVKEKTILVTPKAVADLIPAELKKDDTSMLNNGEVAYLLDFKIEAIPMYNLPESPKSYHTRGRGNGYLIEKDGKRVYISGDTSGIPEMKNLKNINVAFVAMNLPYTMSVSEAADAVLAFKPKKVLPYHYRTPEGFSDVAKFKELVNKADPAIEVVQLDWYPK